MDNRFEFELENDLSEIERLNSILEDLAARGLLPQDKLFGVNLALEELITNVISYAYDDDARHLIGLAFEFKDGKVDIEIADNGREFDPFEEAAKPDLDAAPEDRPIGGLGVHFVKQMMDEYSYSRKNGKNIVRLSKNL
ncbi:MAG: ATP-binding protein [Candidatus Kapaibacterium sp.]